MGGVAVDRVPPVADPQTRRGAAVGEDVGAVGERVLALPETEGPVGVRVRVVRPDVDLVAA